MKLTSTAIRSLALTAAASVGMIGMGSLTQGTPIAQAADDPVPPLVWAHTSGNGAGLIAYFDGHQLPLPNTDRSSSPSFGASRGTFAFAKVKDRNFEIFLNRGGSISQITDNDTRDIDPDLSPTDPTVAFTNQDDDGRMQVHAVDLRGGPHLVLASEGLSRSPSYSPDGAKIAFVSERAGAVGIWQMDADGSNQELMYQSDEPVDTPAYTPDGLSIMFTEYHRDNGDDLVQVHTQSGRVEQVTSTPGLSEEQASYSPDGRFIAFRGYSFDVDLYRVYVMRADGSDARPLSDEITDAVDPEWYPALPRQEQEPNPPAPPPAPVPGGDDPQAPGGDDPQAIDQAGPSVELRGKPKDGARHNRRGIKRIRGNSSDASGVVSVRVAVKLKRGNKCRHLKANGKLGRTTGCRKRFLTVATEPGPFQHKVKKLRKGQYKLVVKARDGLGNVSKHRIAFSTR